MYVPYDVSPDRLTCLIPRAAFLLFRLGYLLFPCLHSPTFSLVDSFSTISDPHHFHRPSTDLFVYLDIRNSSSPICFGASLTRWWHSTQAPPAPLVHIWPPPLVLSGNLVQQRPHALLDHTGLSPPGTRSLWVQGSKLQFSEQKALLFSSQLFFHLVYFLFSHLLSSSLSFGLVYG